MRAGHGAAWIKLVASRHRAGGGPHAQSGGMVMQRARRSGARGARVACSMAVASQKPTSTCTASRQGGTLWIWGLTTPFILSATTGRNIENPGMGLIFSKICWSSSPSGRASASSIVGSLGIDWDDKLGKFGFMSSLQHAETGAMKAARDRLPFKIMKKAFTMFNGISNNAAGCHSAESLGLQMHFQILLCEWYKSN